MPSWDSAFGGRESVSLAKDAQRGLLVCADAKVGPGVSATQEYVARCLVLCVDAESFRLVYLPFLDAPRAGDAPPLETGERKRRRKRKEVPTS